MMKRRTVLRGLGAGLVAVAGGGFWLNTEVDHPHLALSALQDRLDAVDALALRSTGTWGVSRTLHHLAQSVEFSMTGFPHMKSPTFQQTAGRLAFAVFNRRGAMNHNLAEPIPGETVETTVSSAEDSLARLKQALSEFQQFEGDLQPHFAYGPLDKAQYARAHVMHVANHWQEFS